MNHRHDVLPILLLASLAFLTPDLPLRADDGDLDPTWGGDGISSGFANTAPRASGVAPDQQLYFTGNTSLPDDSEFEWWRSDNEGGEQWYGCSHDIPLLDNFDILEVLYDSSDRMLLAGRMTVFGTETVERAFVARFLYLAGGDSCTLDSSFSGGGWEYFDDAPFCDTEDCRLIDIEESGDATTRYVALLESVQNVLMSNYYMVGLTASGSLDPNFGSGGFSQVTAANFGVSAGGGAEIAIDPADKIYVLHSFFDASASFDMDTALTRFLSNGSLDLTFQNAGTYFAAEENDEDTSPRALAIASDGRLSFAFHEPTLYAATLYIYDPSTNIWAGSTQTPLEPRAVAFDGLGRLLYAYDFGGDGIGLKRYKKDLSLGLGGDPTFTALWLDIDEGATEAEFPVDLETPAGRPLVLIDSDHNGGGRQAFLVRLENSLIFADGFEWGSTKYW